MADEKKKEKAADLRRIAELLQKGDELNGTFRQHYGGQAEQLDKELAAAENNSGPAFESREITPEHFELRLRLAEKKGIAAWLGLSKADREAAVFWLRTAGNTDWEKTAADALEELSELREKSADELRQLLDEKEKWRRRYHELASAEPSAAEIFAAACARLLALRELIAELRELNRPLRRPDPSRPQQIIDAAAKLLGLAEKTSDAEARERKEKERASGEKE